MKRPRLFSCTTVRAPLNPGILCVALALTGLCLPPIVTSAKGHTNPPVTNATIIVSRRFGEMAVPRSFLGLSTEYWEVPDLDRHRRLLERVLDMLHVPSDGPMLLRIGGDSADSSAFAIGQLVHRPAWARYELTPRFFFHAGALVRNAHLRLFIDLNTAEDDPATAVRWARAALEGLPAGSVQAFEIGNEPDLFDYWHDRFAHDLSAKSPALIHTGGLTPSRYARVFGAYANALHRAFPRVGIAGLALAQPGKDLAWQTDGLDAADGAVTIVTGHRYPLSECVTNPKAAMYPTVQKLLTNQTSTGMARSVLPAVKEAHERGLPYVVTEMNSVTCGGTAGVSNTFATALWAPNALFSLIKAGVDGANVHLRLKAINAPFTFGHDELIARPLLYGLAMFTHTLGPHAHLIDDTIRANPNQNLTAWAVESQGTLRVLVTNRADHPITVALRLPGAGAGTIQRLSAPSIDSRTGERLDGQSIGPNGRWTGMPSTQQTVVSQSGQDIIRLPRYSDALLSVR